MKTFLLFLLTVLFSVSSIAQEPDLPPPGGEKSYRMIEAIKIWKLTEILDLNSEQMEEFFPKLRKHEEHRKNTFSERRILLLELRELLGQEKPDTDILTSINKITEFDKKKRDEEEKLKKEVMEVLSVKQQAKFLLFEERFEGEIRKIIKGLWKEKGMGGKH
jgi:Spy/CpxP family protein refolding chaperone